MEKVVKNVKIGARGEWIKWRVKQRGLELVKGIVHLFWAESKLLEFFG